MKQYLVFAQPTSDDISVEFIGAHATLEQAQAERDRCIEGDDKHDPSYYFIEEKYTPDFTWEEFNRMHSTDNFYGCVAPDGTWFDSGMTYTTAVTHCCYREDQFDLSVAGEAEWMDTEGQRLGYSIIHSTMLKQMFEKGLIK